MPWAWHSLVAPTFFWNGLRMDKLDPAAVQAMTAQLHRAYCLPGASPATAWTEAHRNRDQRKAVEVLDGLAAAAMVLVSTSEAGR